MKRVFYLIVLGIIYFFVYPYVPHKSSEINNIKGEKTFATPAPSYIPSTIPTQVSDLSFYLVVRVVDGDTIQVDINGTKETVRLIGVDTPEVVDPRKPVQCFGRQASEFTKQNLTGKKVRLESDPTQSDRDKYHRLLRYVYLEDGTLFNKLLIEQGFAHEYTYQSNPYKFQLEFKNAEKEARENKKGLWADNACS